MNNEPGLNSGGVPGVIPGAVNRALCWLTGIACVIAPLILRVGLGLPFYRSGLTKWNSFLSLNPAIDFLFEEEFKFHLFGQSYDLPFPDTLAYFTACAEVAVPILLLFGLATRFSALFLLCQTAVIQLIVPDGWANFHLPWATMAIALIAIGPGRLSIDHGIRGYWERNYSR